MIPPSIIDTSVLVAALVSQALNMPPAVIVAALLRGVLSGVTSAALLAEYRRTLRQPKIAARHRLDAVEVERLFRRIEANSQLLVPPPGGIACPDPRDQHLWDLLATVPEAVLVTGDALLVENPPPFGRVMTPRQFVESYLPHPGG